MILPTGERKWGLGMRGALIGATVIALGALIAGCSNASTPATPVGPATANYTPAAPAVRQTPIAPPEPTMDPSLAKAFDDLAHGQERAKASDSAAHSAMLAVEKPACSAVGGMLRDLGGPVNGVTYYPDVCYSGASSAACADATVNFWQDGTIRAADLAAARSRYPNCF